MTRWTSEVRNDRAVFSELAQWWDAQPPALMNPFLTSSILSCWEDGFDEPDSKLSVLLLQRNGDLVAALPMYRARGRYRSLDQEHIPWYDVITGDDEEVLDEIPRWLDGLRVAHLYRVREESPIFAALANHSRWTVQRTLRGPFARLDRGFEAIRGSSRRKTTRDRHRRRLSERGEVSFADHVRSDDISSTLDEGFRLEASGWKGSKGVSTLDVPGYHKWFRSVAEVAEERGWLRLSSLRLDGRLIAFQYDLAFAGTRYLLITCFDENSEITSLSPGSLLIESVLEHSAQSGLTRYEFGNGPNSWKYDWTSDEREVHDLLTFGSSAAARSLATARRIRRSMANRTRARTGDDKNRETDGPDR